MSPPATSTRKNEQGGLDRSGKLPSRALTIIVVTYDALVASCAQREIMLNHGVLVGEKRNDEDARRLCEAAGGKPARARRSRARERARPPLLADPTKAAKTAVIYKCQG